MDSPATLTYVMREAFEPALRRLRENLRGEGFRIAAELDLAGHIQRCLRIKPAPCVVLYFWPEARLLEGEPIPVAAVLLLPLHVVVSRSAGRTEIRMLRSPGAPEAPDMALVRKLQAELRHSLEKIAMRLSLVS